MERHSSLEEDYYEEPGMFDFTGHSCAFTEATVRNGQVVVRYDDLTKPFSMTSEEEEKYQNFLKLASAEEMEELDVGEEDKTYERKPSIQESEASSTSEDLEDKAKQEAEWREELSKIDYEITGIREVLAYKLKRSSELKHKLGITPWKGFKEDMEQGIRQIQESYQRTSQTLKQAGEKTSAALGNIGSSVSKKFGEVKNSQTFKTIEEKVETAYESVKDPKIQE
ncbi:tumor protein D52-like isoform X2 [Limulus polyphemus]|uniref:Tumor protein D52-like isoform X2 n=1 Tax=Limulus polyphemus TaxID=6850 RepID=A0ABM1SWV7_LIMPO|nr:tumor protein D52-like isoform X2 [Limulus polyphemus]